MSSSRDNEESVLPIPNLKLQQLVFTLLKSKASKKDLEEAKINLLKGIESDGKLFKVLSYFLSTILLY